MRVVHHIQGSPEWLEWRKFKLTASKAAAIMELCPYQTPFHLWEVELGVRPPDPDNPHMQRGRFLEPYANAFFCKENDVLAAPPICILHPDYDDIAASLDGYFVNDQLRKTVLEIKCPCDSEWINIQVNGIEVAYHHYITQVKHQLACSEADVGILYVYHLSEDLTGTDPSDIVTLYESGRGMVKYKQESLKLEIHRDQIWEQDEWLPALNAFRDNLKTKKPPVINPERDVFVNHGAAWKKLAEEWLEGNRELKEYEVKVELAKSQMVAAEEAITDLANAMGYPNMRGFGIQHSHQVRNGQVNWEKMARDFITGQNLDVLAIQYRKTHSVINKIKPDKLAS